MMTLIKHATLALIFALLVLQILIANHAILQLGMPLFRATLAHVAADTIEIIPLIHVRFVEDFVALAKIHQLLA